MNRIKKYAYTTIFLLITMCLGLLSSKNLVNFYLHDEIDYNEWTPELGSKFETDIASTFYNKFGFVNFNGALSRFLSLPSMNGVVKLNNGYLFTAMRNSSDETLQEYADAAIRLDQYLQNRGTHLVYATTTYTSGKYDPQLPVGIDDFGNGNIDRFLKMIQKAGIDTIDFREKMYEDGIDHYDMMYKTDHHWTTEAGFYAYRILEKYITEKTGCEVNNLISDIQNYTITRYEKWHLGSRGQRTGIYYAGIDDFDLIIPNFETWLKNNNAEGSFQDLIINMKPLENRDITSRYTYDHVMNNALYNYENDYSYNEIKILLIADSFAKAVNPYLILGFHKINYVYNMESEKVTPKLIEEIDPDVVIMLYYPSILEPESKGFSFSGF